MAGYTVISTCLSDVVNGSHGPNSGVLETTVGPSPVPAGKRVRIQCFGGSEIRGAAASPVPARIQLWWGSDGGGWEPLRDFGLSGVAFESHLNATRTSTGSESVKVTRVNNDNTAKTIVAWVEGYIQ
jgi:hypothetical protein